MGRGSHQECRISLPMAFVLVFLAILIALGVGIITYFASTRSQTVCKCVYPNGILEPGASAEKALQQCSEIAKSKKLCKYKEYNI